MSLVSQFARACGLARLGVSHGLARRAIRDRDHEGGQEFGACLAWPGAGAGVVGMRRERRHLVGSPDLQRHRSQGLLELAGIVGGKQAETAPFARLQRRAPQPQQLTLCGQVT
jgi:hypothetical protein